VKYLVLIGVVFAVIWLIKLSRPISSGQRDPSPESSQPMVACAYCGVHFPELEAVHAGNNRYCSQAHRDLKEGSA